MVANPENMQKAGRGRVLIVGAGPAGLTAGFDAATAGWRVTVLEKDPVYVGGISRTVRHEGNRFDIGGHRFFSKSPEVTRWWKDRLPADFIEVRRMSRIYYRGKFFDYPLKPWNALSNLGLFTSIGCVLSYAWSRLFPIRPEKSLEDWVSNRFGRRLFRIFFKTYTEKVWGIPTSELSADWAAQRIKGLSLSKAVLNAFKRRPPQGEATIKTLIDTFSYPRLGPGQMWEKTAADILALGGSVEMGHTVSKIRHENSRVTQIEAIDTSGAVRKADADHFILSMPLRESVLAFDPPLSSAARTAAKNLGYRDFLTVALVVEGENPFPDNWIYIHEPDVKLGRIQNFRNWSDLPRAGIFLFRGRRTLVPSRQRIDRARQTRADAVGTADDRAREQRLRRPSRKGLSHLRSRLSNKRRGDSSRTGSVRQFECRGAQWDAQV